MQIGSEAQATVDSGSPVLGPIRIEFGEEIFPEQQFREPSPVFYEKSYDKELALLVEKIDKITDILEDIKYFSVPWYLRLLNWLKEKTSWHGKQKAG